VTIDRNEYEILKRQAGAWRSAIGGEGQNVIFNAVRDNNGEGVEAGILAKKLRALV
jgi:hypothetical protein